MVSSKRILLLTYYFPPCNYVAVNRPYSFAHQFSKSGYEVEVVTRHWKGNENLWSDYLASNHKKSRVHKISPTLTVHYLPYKAIRFKSNVYASKIYTLCMHLQGKFNFDLDCMQFYEYAAEMVTKRKFDYILVSIPPINLIKLGHKLSKKYDIPLLLDIRDFENDITLGNNKPTGLLRRIEHINIMHFLKYWLRQVKLGFTVSPTLTAYLIRHTGHEFFTVTNGFDEALLDIEHTENPQQFTMSCIGTLYKEADMEPFYKGLELLFERESELKILINLIGIEMQTEVTKRFKEIIPAKNIRTTPRIAKTQGLEIAAASHILFLVGYTNATGINPTKFFEYLGLRKNILQAPGDGQLIEEMLVNLDIGKAPHTPEEIYESIIAWYREWEIYKTLSFGGTKEGIIKYSRENQFKLILEKMGTLVI